MSSREFCERLIRRARHADLILPSHLLDPLESYVRLLARWNAKLNLTALPVDRPTDQAIDRLLVEPLAAARHVPDTANVWFDLGSGGGSPAIPLRIARPSLRLTMVESKVRKAAFLSEAVRLLSLTDTRVENVRFEQLADRFEVGPAQLVTVRAVKANAALFESAGQLLSPGGRLLLFGGPGSRASSAEFAQLGTDSLGSGPPYLTILQRL
jgi:16S rRNA (guanine527-N7)-methyltransferase